MAAVLTGTPVAVAWGTSANPAAQNITIPADCTAVFMFWAFDGINADGETLSTATLASASASQSFSITTLTGYYCATGVSAWYNPPTGTQSLDVAWTTAPTEGPVCVVVFVKDGDTTSWRDADADHDINANAVSVTLTTVSGDLVLKFDQRYDAGGNVPALSAAWANGQTQTGQASENARLSYISATGTTQVCNSEDEDYSSLVAISIGPAGIADTLFAQACL
jgi:hypothetical protein